MDDLRAFARQILKVYGYYLKLGPVFSPELGNFSLHFVDDEVRQEIEKMNAADMTLYQFVRCVLAAGGPRFD